MFFLNQGNFKGQQKAQAKVRAIKANIRQQKAEEEKIIRIPIKRYNPYTKSIIVEVTFNDRYIFDLVLDTGATITTITQQMQRTMQLNTIGEQWCIVADGRRVKFGVCQINSLCVNKATINYLNVAVGTKETDEGLLGQDFLSNYEVRILKEEVHLYPRS